MKILSAQQIREADKATIASEGIGSVDLMERAGSRLAERLTGYIHAHQPVVVFAGVGNNGGDALVVARKLLEYGHTVSTYVVRYHEEFSVDMQINLDRLQRTGHEIKYILEEGHFPGIPPEAVIVDGIFGTGLNKTVKGLAAACIGMINASIAEVFSIDIPSGLPADGPLESKSIAVQATRTFSFEVPKLAFLIPESGAYAGIWEVVPIGLDQRFMTQCHSGFEITTSIKAFKNLLDRKKFAHKGQFGHVLISAGSLGKAGAAVLAARGALHSGAGLVTCHVPRVAYEIVQSTVPEAMCYPDPAGDMLTSIPPSKSYSAWVIGPGIGTTKKTRRMLKLALEQAAIPMLLDADALNIIADEKWHKLIPKNAVITPHVGEFDRLFGDSSDGFDRLSKLRMASAEMRCVIVLKGAYTAVANSKGEIFFNSTGNPGMATGGSGDVLSGVVGSLLAQCRSAENAARCGVFIHGVAGDIAAKQAGEAGVTASHIARNCGIALAQSLNLSL